MKMMEYNRLGTVIKCNDYVGVLLDLDNEYGTATLYNKMNGLVSFDIDEDMEVTVVRHDLDMEGMVDGQAELVLSLVSDGWCENGERYFNLTPYLTKLEMLVKMRNILAVDS